MYSTPKPRCLCWSRRLSFSCQTVPLLPQVVALADTPPSIIRKWDADYSGLFPYYLIGAAIAGLIQFVNRLAGWEMSILVLPAVYVIYRSYCMPPWPLGGREAASGRFGFAEHADD